MVSLDVMLDAGRIHRVDDAEANALLGFEVPRRTGLWELNCGPSRVFADPVTLIERLIAPDTKTLTLLLSPLLHHTYELHVSEDGFRFGIAVAELPDPVVQCFRSPLELQYKHAELITSAMESDRKGVLRRAERLRQSERVPASAVVAALIGKQRGAGDTPQEIRIAGTLAGRVTWNTRGQATVRLMPGRSTERMFQH